jgi:ribosomal protein S12 methylthiotransferase accessory factor
MTDRTEDLRALEAIAELYRAALPPGEVEEFPVRGMDEVACAVWSVTLHPEHGSPGAGGHGYGATEQEARVGALGEMTEVTRSAATLAPLPRTTASYAELVRQQGRERVVDPRELALEAGSPYDDDRPLSWWPMTRLSDGETVHVPAEFVASTGADVPSGPPAGGWLTTIISNGLGAGAGDQARERAVGHALLELLQRDGNGLSFRAMDRGVVVDLDGIGDPGVRALLDRCAAAGVDVKVKLASTDFGIADVYAVGTGADEHNPVMATACGEAAHPDRERAVRKALLEFVAARTRKAFTHGPLEAVRDAAPPGYLERYLESTPLDRAGEEQRALDAMVGWTGMDVAQLRSLLAGTVLSQRSTVALADLPSTPVADSAALLADVSGRLHAAGMDVLVADFPSADGSVHAVKAVVPGLEVETMSYGRIGERGVRRLLERDDDRAGLVAVGSAPPAPGWAPVHLTAAAQERLGGPAWLDRARVDQVVGELYPLYREPGRHAAALLHAGRV